MSERFHGFEKFKVNDFLFFALDVCQTLSQNKQNTDLQIFKYLKLISKIIKCVRIRTKLDIFVQQAYVGGHFR
ncbi:MAG: hypothetical protein OHK0038_12420 [Flammeovirgaceae bacterium]